MAEYGLHKTLYSRCKRWGENGIFARMLLELADQGGGTDTLMIDATHLKAHRTSSGLLQLGAEKRRRGRLIGRTKGRMKVKLHAVTDAAGRPLWVFLTVG